MKRGGTMILKIYLCNRLIEIKQLILFSLVSQDLHKSKRSLKLWSLSTFSSLKKDASFPSLIMYCNTESLL